MAKSLTSRSVKNSVVALVFYLMNLVLQFVSRKIFIDYLGEELLGLNTTITSLLQFLNIAELGIGSAIGYTLYKPIYEKDSTTINDIVTLQGWLYRRIAGVIIVASAILLLFFPLIFEKMTLPLWYAYASFIVLLFASLLGYFVNYRQILLSADLKEYKIQYSYKAAMLLKLLLQIVAIKYLHNGYIWWLLLEFLFAVVASVVLNIVIKRTYPQLAESLLPGKELVKRYPDVLKKTKQLFFHKIGGVVITKVTPLVIYGVLTLEMVAIYGNYMLIVSGVISLITAIFNSINAGVGNVVASGDKERIYNVFNELFSVRFLVTAVISLAVYTFTQPFMKIWMGEGLMLENNILILFVLITFISLNRLTPDAFINAYGLFHDIWSPIIEALLNIGLSLLLGLLWGIGGIMAGVLISLFLVIFCWKQYFLFKKGFKRATADCIKIYLIHLLPLIITYPAAGWLYRLICPGEISNLFVWSLHALVYVVISFVLLLILLSIFTSGMRRFISRVGRMAGTFLNK